MKKLYFTIFVIFIFPLLFSFRVFAADNYDQFRSDFQAASGWDIGSSNVIKTYWEQNPNYQMCCGFRNGATSWIVMFGETLSINNNIVSGYLRTPVYAIYSASNIQTFTNSNQNSAFSRFVGSSPYIYDGLSGVDYENPVFSSSIPVPDMTVTFVGVGLTLPTNTNGVYVDCIVPQEDAFYIQLQAKYSVCDLVQINLNNGVISYDYLDWVDGDNIDIYGLQDNESSVHVTAADFQNSWNTLINGLLENSSFPQFTSNVPFWIQNPSAQKYLDAQSRYKNVLMRQAPLYGSRMELFARYYAIVDNSVYVGKWIHWNSANPSNTEELGNKYQQDQPFPGFQNTSSDTNLPDQEDTYTNFGENTSVDNNPYTQVIVNNNVPNYPDYPTVATYNHDNILVQFINTAKQLPNFFGDFGSFLTASFAFIPSYIWAVIGFGFMCSIVVMIIKVL